jgi:hypothetical protein
VKPSDELTSAHATITALQVSLSVANGRIRDLELLAVRQNDRITETMRHANAAEERYRELLAKWQLARREAEQAKIAKRRV